MSELADTRLDKLFPTPFMRHVWADSAELNKELRHAILAREREDRGDTKSNVGGWQSQDGVLEWCGRPGKVLIGRMVELANEATRQLFAEYGINAETRWKINVWANVNRVGDFNKTHVHPGATWSGTYYVDPGEPAPDEPHGTPFNLLNPAPAVANCFFASLLPGGILVRPEAGLMILFPSYVPHLVFPHRGKRPRISIAFNLRREPYP